MRAGIFVIFLLLLLAVPASALEGWNYYREIFITNNVDQDLTDYQIKITLDTASLIAEGKMRSDCGDIRFADAEGN